MTDTELRALQAFQDAYNGSFGWPRSPIDPDDPIQRSTLAAIRAALPHLILKTEESAETAPLEDSFFDQTAGSGLETFAPNKTGESQIPNATE